MIWSNEYSPFAPLCVCLIRLVAVLVSVTDAPEIRAPDGSITVPLRPVVLVCANDTAAQTESRKSAKRRIERKSRPPVRNALKFRNGQRI